MTTFNEISAYMILASYALSLFLVALVSIKALWNIEFNKDKFKGLNSILANHNSKILYIIVSDAIENWNLKFVSRFIRAPTV